MENENLQIKIREDRIRLSEKLTVDKEKRVKNKMAKEKFRTKNKKV